MIVNTLRSINWVDILVLALAVRVVYIALQTGFVVEFSKLVGVFLTIFVSFHYYTMFGGFALKRTDVPDGLLYALAFVALWGLTALLCKLIRDGLLLLFTIQAQSMLDRWGAAIISVFRFVLLASMMMFLFLVTGHPYLQAKTMSSLSHRYLLGAAPAVYGTICNRVVSKIFPAEKYNDAVRLMVTQGSR